MGKSLVSCFFETQCRANNIMRFKVEFRWDCGWNETRDCGIAGLGLAVRLVLAAGMLRRSRNLGLEAASRRPDASPPSRLWPWTPYLRPTGRRLGLGLGLEGLGHITGVRVRVYYAPALGGILE